MNRYPWPLMAIALMAGPLASCYDVPEISPRPTPYLIVKSYARDAFAAVQAQPEGKEGLQKFAQKAEGAQSRDELKAAWRECFPAGKKEWKLVKTLEERVLTRAVMDPRWPPEGVEDDTPFISGVRDAASEVLGAAPPSPKE
ncbi:MAG: hypothetical protein HY716_09605 [Planctomycetes bacterium]|nr:hypothetical protein [Planctomycetota bacterium]